MTATLYLDIVRELVKANGNSTPRTFIHDYHALQDQFEAKALKTLQGILKRARAKLLPRIKVTTFSELYKSASDDMKAQLRSMLLASFAGASDDLIETLEPLIDKLAQSFASAYDVKLNFEMVNKAAVSYLRDHAENYFTQLADDQAQGIFDAVAEKMADPAGYTLKDVIQGIRSAFGSQQMYFPNKVMDATDWATVTARTETARAASYSQRAAMESLDLRTWEWNTQETGCDECDENDGEIVTIGENFPSGDDQPPIHPCCRCICTAVQDELTSLDDSSDDT